MNPDRKIAAFLFALAASLFLLVAHWLPEEADTEVGFQGARAIATRGAFSLAKDSPSSIRILERFPPDVDAYNCGLDRRTGKQYPYWGVAYMAAGVPMYWLGRSIEWAAARIDDDFRTQTFTAERIIGSDYFPRIFVMSLQPLFAAAAVALIFLASRRSGASRGASLASALIVGFCSSFGVQARSGLSDAQAVFFVAWGVERAFAVRESLGRRWDLVTLGIAMGLGFLTKLHVAFAVAPLPILFLGSSKLRAELPRVILWIAAGALSFVAAFFLANTMRWGDPLTTGYEKSTAQAWFRIPVLLGLKAILFSPSKGLVVYAFPTVVLAILGLVILARTERVVALVLFLSALGALAMPASTIEWHGAWAFGPRYALLALPALAVAGARAIDAMTGWVRVVPWVLALLGFAAVLPGFLTSPFAAIAVSMEGARIQWPEEDPSFPADYSPGDRDAERFQRLCMEAGPLNFLRVQHALARAAISGRDGLSYRGDLGLDRDGEILPPDQPEYRDFGSIGWVGFATRFKTLAHLWIPALYAIVGIYAALGLRRALHAARHVP
jgi:hypothetical protein